MISFKKYDASVRWHYRADMVARAKQMGYEYISEMFLQEYLKHGSLRKAAKEIGLICKRTVWLHLGNMGIKFGGRGGPNNKCKWATPEIDAKILRLKAAGKSVREIGEAVGVSREKARGRIKYLTRS